MKVRKLAVALALAGGLGSGVAQALGLGEIELQSFLNEPLDAEINLRQSQGISPGEVFVNVAPQSAFDRVGIDRSFFLTKLNFQVTTAPNGGLVVNLSSRDPLREPYLNFLVEVTWPNGRLMREYAVLVDPPVYAEESGVQEQVTAPSTSQPRQQQQRQLAAPARETFNQQARAPGVRTLGPTNSADTLWKIAAQIRPSDQVTMQQVMLAIQDLNPGAFIDGNINRLKRGEILRIPDEDQIRSRSRAAANQEVAVQNRDFATPSRTIDATDEAAVATADSGATGAGSGDQLRLVAADDSSARDTEEGGSAGGDSGTPGGVDAGAAVAMEELESARRENEELSGRVDDLQDQVQTLQRLLELKNSQLAQMQAGQAETKQGGSGVPADEAAARDDLESQVSGEESLAEARPDQAAESDTETSVGDDLAGLDETAETAGTEAPAGPSDTVIAEPEADEPQQVAAPAESQPVPVPADTEAASKPFPDNIIQAITSNVMYQVALAGSLVLLLLALLALARRNANREKAFYEQLNSEVEGDQPDGFDLTFDEEVVPDTETPEDDAVAEADAYIAYGRHDQAAQTLETAISREPSRTDLRLRLLGVYAEIQDRDSFDKQLREIEALEDDNATAEARKLQDHLEEDDGMPSIDELESQLRSGGYQTPVEEPEADLDEPEAGLDEPDADLEGRESEPAPDNKYESNYESTYETDFEDLDLDLPEDEPEKPASSDDLIEYDLSGIDAAEDQKAETTEFEETDEPFDYSLNDDLAEQDGATETDELDLVETGTDAEESSEDDDLSLELDDLEADSSDETDLLTSLDTELDSEPDTELDTELGADRETDLDSALDEASSDKSPADESLTGEEPQADKSVTDKMEVPAESSIDDDELDIDSTDPLDESFLDELDAELDKVAGEDELPENSSESALDDLELDVTDEDLALMEEFSESDGDTASGAPELAEDDEPSLDEELDLEDTLDNEEPPLATDKAGEGKAGAREPDRELDESDLGDDDDFDFLAGTDEAATKLDLARAYVEMGDADGARDILEEVALEGNEEQKAEARDLLKNLS